jgi:hypothetical protein
VTASRRRLSERIDLLAADHEGAAFVEAVERFALELGEEERELLGQVLVERASERGFEYGLIRRIGEPRWKLFGRRPQEPGRSGAGGTT